MRQNNCSDLHLTFNACVPHVPNDMFLSKIQICANVFLNINTWNQLS